MDKDRKCWDAEPSDNQEEANKAALREDTVLDAQDYAHRVGVWLREVDGSAPARKKAALHRALVTARDLVGLLEELRRDA